ncbi:MAG TPA: hypothetical protein EYG03_04185 [Planctomycetes bacterium]|nr:hypothetical protein [Fuerstiella sp.]HIK91177.1 hypothetical protein [Planctomycetota bacterium]
MEIGSRRELFVDDYLIDRLTGHTQQMLHHPVAREIALVHDAPWEGTGCGYHSVFQDGDLYRMYYKAWHLEVGQGKLDTGRHPLFCCYAESDDGINWRKPKLGLHEFQGSKDNNITMVSGKVGSLNVDAGHPAIFKDENPGAPADARYKAIFRSSKPNGLLPFKSPDGLNWSPMTDAPILHSLGAFDSQNLAFWDDNIGKYRAYWRIFTAGVTTDKEWKPGGIRAIRTATSDDLINWGPHTDLTYVDSPPQQLYTNQIKPYHRAPHILMGFPTRYIDRGWSQSMNALPALKQRELRASSSQRYGTAITDALFMASRDGTKFTRWNEAFLRPGIERSDAWHYGHQYIGWHLVETKSQLTGASNELSMYATESYWHGKGSALRRYSLRLDGFVSVNAPAGSGNELVTKPLTFTGSALHLNFATSAAGTVRVELQHPDGTPIVGYELEACHDLFGDTVDRVVGWRSGRDVSRLNGKTVRLRFELRDADLYSCQFAG